jgi:hypothetical protein
MQTFYVLWRLYIEHLFAQEVLGFPATQNCTKAGAYMITVWKRCSHVRLNWTEISTGTEIKTLELNTALRRHFETTGVLALGERSAYSYHNCGPRTSRNLNAIYLFIYYAVSTSQYITPIACFVERMSEGNGRGITVYSKWCCHLELLITIFANIETAIKYAPSCDIYRYASYTIPQRWALHQ